jgi:glycosyltransferase involved in cell wall biosynthesis
MATDQIFVGVPVYRGWEFVAQTLQSIHVQTYKNLEVLISVDANDERSADACASFLGDTRFRLVVQPHRLGWAGNINWLLAQARGDFFCYYQHDDLTDPEYFAVLVEAARSYSDAVVLYSDIESFGAKQDLVQQDSIAGAPLERVLWQVRHLSWAAFRGLIRLEAARAAGPLRLNEFDSYAEDVVWIAKLARYGELIRVPRTLYFKRLHTNSTHGKWFGWDRDKRRAAWIIMCVGLLEAGLPITTSHHERERLAKTVLNLLILGQEQFALYRPRDAEERQQLIADFLAAAQGDGLCTLRPEAD